MWGRGKAGARCVRGAAPAAPRTPPSSNRKPHIREGQMRGRGQEIFRPGQLRSLRPLLKRAALLALAALLLLPMGTTAQAATGHPFLESLTEAPPASKLLAPGAVAVDHASGAVFVGDPVAGYVDVFSASGAYESRFGAGTLDAGAIAIDESSGEGW